MIRRAHPFLSFHRPHDRKRSQRYVCRDAIAQLNVMAALAAQGIEQGHNILNYPRGSQVPSDLLPVDADLGAEDLVVDCTRSALDDGDYDTRRPLTRAYTDLEEHILRACRPWFAFLDRSQLKLPPQLQALLPAGFEGRAQISFSQRMWARYKELHGRNAERKRQPLPPEPRSAAFVLNLPGLWDGGPSLLCAFAMDSVIAAGWSAILRYKHPEWLLAPGFRMVELVLTEMPEYPTSERFALDWRIEELIYTRA